MGRPIFVGRLMVVLLSRIRRLDVLALALAAHRYNVSDLTSKMGVDTANVFAVGRSEYAKPLMDIRIGKATTDSQFTSISGEQRRAFEQSNSRYQFKRATDVQYDDECRAKLSTWLLMMLRLWHRQ